MPEWLLEEDKYDTLKDKDAFINKSIFNILKLLAILRIQTHYTVNKSKVNPAIKVISSFLLVFIISISRNMLFSLIVSIFLLFIVSLLNIDKIKYTLRGSMFASILTLIILIPSILMGNANNSIIIVLKVFCCVMTVNLLACTTHWNDITGCLKFLFVPDMFIFIFDITLKYIAILGELSLDMLYALKIRSVGKNNKKGSFLSGIMGTTFIKSKEMAEDMYDAMECRGFSGEYNTYNSYKQLRITDILFIVLDIIIIVTYLYIGRV